MTPQSPSDGVAPTGSDYSALPQFVRKSGGAVWVDPSKLPAEKAFWVFVERLFSQGARFVGLDYDAFQGLLFPTGVSKAANKEIRLASEIVVFPAVRRALYKGVRLMDRDARAEYMFEPAFLEVVYQEPVYGETDAFGETPVVGSREKTRLDPTQLDLDEFIADMWTKGVRFGIQVATVQKAIAANKADRVVVASELAPKQGHDAELHEECEGLHRDDSPMIKAGKADLRRFKNRFPQIAKGTRMMKKIPLQLGENGYKVTGDPVAPDVPKDVDLNTVSGPGTKILTLPDGEFIVAVHDGFINIDTESNQISVTEKIENKGGISAKTTGDLSLTVDEFVEHGEVQEGRTVEGKHMRFTSTVFGSLVSEGGRIEIDDNLSGGSATSPKGSVTIKKRASNARIEAVGGNIDIHYAENSSIIGTNVHIGHAINCEVIADSVRVDLAQACSVAGRCIEIATADARKGVASTVSVLVPDCADSDRKITALKTAIADLARQLELKSADLKKWNTDPDFAKFLSIRDMVRTGKVTVSPALEQNFRNMQSKHAGTLKLVEKLGQEIAAVQQSTQSKQAAIQQLQQAQASESAGLSCRIVKVVGETQARLLHTRLGVADFSGVSGNDLGKMLRDGSGTPQRIFSDDHGNVEWVYKPPT
ncbi:MAG: FapA family protein [Rhodoferax sp.]|nr:FapA family protein [Rhodoferax sp.]MCF8209441.1 FapA family protein [Rhodoferax sp.]